MGWKLKVLAGLTGLLLLGAGAWPLALICFLFISSPLWTRSRTGPTGARKTRPVSAHRLLAVGMFLLSAVAFASGGALSPFVFFAAGLASLFWRSLVRGLPRSDVVPVRDSILVRPRLMPFTWSAVAELKPGSDDFARAASSFSGKLLVFTDTGKVYSVPSCFALSRGEAEAKIMDEFRREALAGRAGAFLLPLDSIQATGVLSRNLSRMKYPMEQIARSAPRIPGALFIECGGGHVLRASVLDQTPAPKPKLPGDPEVMSNPPLTWEVFESVAKGTRWPQPDSLSNLLDSMVATRGVPLAERVRGLETEGDGLKIQSLSGDEVRASRTQLRALVSLYS